MNREEGEGELGWGGKRMWPISSEDLSQNSPDNSNCPSQPKYSPPEWMLIRPKLNNILQLICNIPWMSQKKKIVSNVNLIDSSNKLRPSHACYVLRPHPPFYSTTLNYLGAGTIHEALATPPSCSFRPLWTSHSPHDHVCQSPQMFFKGVKDKIIR